MTIRLTTLALVVTIVVGAALPAFAQDGNFVRDPATITADEVNDIAEKMFCLECENIPLNVCGTQACIQWRDEIRFQLAEGKTEEEILEYFRVNHGEHALADPRDPLLSGLTNIIPIVISVLAVTMGGVFLYRWQTGQRGDAATVQSSPSNSDAPAPDNDYLTQLERDLNA
jgi:cytochrome c-type biogenesis protein CcmH